MCVCVCVCACVYVYLSLSCMSILQMYTNALVKRAGIFAGLGEIEKCQTCFSKALAIDSNCADVFIYRARVSFKINGSMDIHLTISLTLSHTYTHTHTHTHTRTHTHTACLGS